MTVPNSRVVIVPSPSLSNRENASSNSTYERKINQWPCSRTESNIYLPSICSWLSSLFSASSERKLAWFISRVEACVLFAVFLFDEQNLRTALVKSAQKDGII